MCKWVASIIWAISSIGSIAMGKIFEVESEYSREKEYNLRVFIISLVSSFILGMLFWGIGEIIEKLTETNKYLSKLTVIMEEKALEKGQWLCSTCHTKNGKNDIICKVCGHCRV